MKRKYPLQYEKFPQYIQLMQEYKSYQKHKTQKMRIAKSIHDKEINYMLQNSKFNAEPSWRLIKANRKETQNH